MAELATLARPYAEAFFQVAQKADLKTASEQLDFMAAVATNPQLRQFADAPKVDVTQVVQVITSVVGAPLTPASQNLLRTVVENGRLSVLSEIAVQFRALVNAHSGVSDAVIYSAFPIDAGQLSEVMVSIEQRFKRKLKATVKLQPELIGGIRVVVGDEVLDTSVKARLEQMKAALTA
jgi:F-type H+-transporting ATPase subunit delta